MRIESPKLSSARQYLNLFQLAFNGGSTGRNEKYSDEEALENLLDELAEVFDNRETSERESDIARNIQSTLYRILEEEGVKLELAGMEGNGLGMIHWVALVELIKNYGFELSDVLQELEDVLSPLALQCLFHKH